jgi:hypothetical protein
MIRRWLTLASGALLLGCSWSRFDDVTSDTPVVILEKPGGVGAGFGSAMTPVTLDGRALLLVHGTPGRTKAALFDLGTGTSPLEDALSENFCTSETGGCFLGSSSAAIPRGVGPSGDEVLSCYALGVGAKLDNDAGVLIECEDKTVFTIPVPDGFDEQIQQGLDNALPEIVALASDDREEPAIVAASVERNLGFYYANVEAEPVVLDAGEHQVKGFGETVNIARAGNRNLVVLGAPTLSAIHLFAADDGSAPTYLGCLRGDDRFGRALAAGDLFDAPALAVSDSERVTVFDVARLLELDAASESSCIGFADLPDDAEVTSVTCGETGAVKGCGASDFGVSVAIGDVDGDDDGELVVGAPGMKARDASNAGAVAYFDLEDPADTELTDLKFIASAESGDRLGTSLAAARIESRHVVVAGVPGSGRSAVFYCPSFLPGRLGGGRCD